MLVLVAPRLCGQGLSVRPGWRREVGYLALEQAAHDAATDHAVLIVASHPDDRWVMPAAYLRFARGWRVDVLMMTRGEGGQNSEGSEIGDELGWKRTLEAEACVAMLDARAWYLNRQDAGYCRSKQEAVELWGEDTAYDVARIIRTVRPDVVLTTHTPDEDHGHDLALLEFLRRGIPMAADPDVDIDGLPPHRVSKAFRGPAESERAAVRDSLPMQDVDLARGATYRRLAYAALKQHRSQEPIRPMEDLFPPVVELYPMLPFGETGPEAWTLDEGLPSLNGDPAILQLRAELEELEKSLGNVAQLVERAVELRERLGKMVTPEQSDTQTRLDRRREALERIIRHGSAFQVTADVDGDATATAGQRFPFSITIQNGGERIFRDLEIRAVPPARLELGQLPDLAKMVAPSVVHASYLAPEVVDRREWLENLFQHDRFEPPVRLRCKVTVVERSTGRRRFDLHFPCVVRADVRPPVELDVIPRALLLQPKTTSRTFTVRVTRRGEQPLDDKLVVLAPPGFVVMGSPVRVRMVDIDHQFFQFELRPPPGLRPGAYNLHVRLGKHRTVVTAHRIDVRVPDGLRVGLVPGADDNAKLVLRGLIGPDLDVLEPDELAIRDFSDFDTIVVDIRALRERPGGNEWRAARAAFPRLLEFVRSGGRLVVFYHKDTEFNLDQAHFKGWPYPLVIGKGRVTREDRPVKLLLPDHVLLTTPNRIRPEDWDGWSQERGLYFPAEYSREHYQEILEMSDEGQKPERGSLLYARYGEGDYIYCALSLYRQLDNFHPGACRLFANLVSSTAGR